MPSNKYALFRYHIIDKLIRNKHNPYPSKQDLKQACQEELYGMGSERISDSTIEKDLFAMRYEDLLGYHAPIRYSKLEKGYYYKDSNYSISKISLNERDEEAIKFAVNTLNQFKGIKVFKDFQYAISKIVDRINLSESIQDSSIEKYIQFDQYPEVKGSEYLPTLLSAIKIKNTVVMEYRKFDDGAGVKSYQINPYLLKEFRHRWYLIGYDNEINYIKTFGLDRIISITQTEEKFKIDDYFNPDSFFKNCYGITAFEKDPVEIQLSLTPNQARYIISMPMHHSQKIINKTKGEVVISIYVRLTWELIMDILAMGNNVKVISPINLKNKLQQILQESLNNYKA
ncbi:WYL domain-containing protein [Vicingus serpentipes]|uniref:WYL domain-containing protein n=1 Tax=Vicingus serpentipes TaxID=1926625 RepID=A0A5C6RUZ1_9FLAO|nr:WYL domain-containing protein [Vicingus serpentipes]TXB66161.1 WYL domain-containing protein [Vicingus serpentipes]